MKAAKDKKLEEAVAMWFMQKCSEGVPIPGSILMAKALHNFTQNYTQMVVKNLKQALGSSRIFSIDMGSVSLQYKVRH